MASPDSSELEAPAGQGMAMAPREVTATQGLFLARLRQLLERRYQSTVDSLTPEQLRVLDRAIYSTFCDCLELGLNSQARALLRQHTDG